MHLGPAEWIGIVSLVVLALIGVATILATRRFGNRRRRVTLIWNASSLLPDGRSPDDLQVTYKGVPVKDPYLLSVRLRNSGPSDVASGHFDSAKPFRINLACSMYGLTDASDSTVTEVDVSNDSTVVSLRPTLLRRGAEWTFEAIVGGMPSPTVMSSLVDTDVVEVRASEYRERRRDFNLVLVGSAGAVIAALTSTVAALFIGHSDNPSPSSGYRPEQCLTNKLAVIRPADALQTEVAGGPTHTWTDPCVAGGIQGQSIRAFEPVKVSCALRGFAVADGNPWWYRVASAPWSGEYFVSADAFYNNGKTSGSLSGTPFVDPAVPRC